MLAMGRTLQHGREQASGVLALGIVDDIGSGTDLNDTVLAHDHHTIADLADQSQVMTDEQQGHAAVAPDVVQELDYLPLYRHV